MIERRMAGGESPRHLHGSAQWWAELARQPGIVVPLLTATGSDKLIVGGEGIIWGLNLWEFAGAGVRYQILDGSDANGSLFLESNSGANGQFGPVLPVSGVVFRRGLFFHVVSGTGTVRGGLSVTLA